MFWDNFWPNFFANLVADGLIIGTTLFLIERHFRRKDDSKREIESEKARKENLRIVVNMLWEEVEHNRKQLKLLIDNLGKRPRPNLIYPCLETSAWEIIDRQLIIDGLKSKDSANLLKIYNRTYTVNKMYYQMLDKIEWIRLGTDSTIRTDFVDAVIDRSKELLSFIEEVFPDELIKSKVKRN